jgi:hypothetical protein
MYKQKFCDFAAVIQNFLLQLNEEQCIHRLINDADSTVMWNEMGRKGQTLSWGMLRDWKVLSNSHLESLVETIETQLHRYEFQRVTS